METQVVRVPAYQLTASNHAWDFALANASNIEAHWQKRISENPSFFNGAVHLLQNFEITELSFSGEMLKTDFASFLYWRESGYPDKSVRDCFGSALLRSSDGRIILGRQSPGNINSGLTYFPGGFIDQRDVSPDHRIDVAASVAREISEELGYQPGTFNALPGAYLTFDGQLLSIAIEHVSHLDSAQLLKLAGDHIASESKPELESVVAVSGAADFEHLDMPNFTRALLLSLLPGA